MFFEKNCFFWLEGEGNSSDGGENRSKMRIRQVCKHILSCFPHRMDIRCFLSAADGQEDVVSEQVLEGMTKEIQALAISIHGLAKDMEQML